MRVEGILLLVDGWLVQNGRVSAVRSVAKQFIKDSGPRAYREPSDCQNLCP